jgi:hypothetical protein
MYPISRGSSVKFPESCRTNVVLGGQLMFVVGAYDQGSSDMTVTRYGVHGRSEECCAQLQCKGLAVLTMEGTDDKPLRRADTCRGGERHCRGEL